MNTKQRIGLAIGGGVVAVGAAVGVGAMAANLANSDSTAQQGTSGYGQGPGGGTRQQFDTTEMAAALASKLGVDETKMKTALDNAMQAGRPSGGDGTQPSGAPTGAAPSGAPTGAAPSGGPSAGGQRGGMDNTKMLTTMATSIATELNLDQSTVLAALQEVWTQYGPGASQPSSQPTS